MEAGLPQCCMYACVLVVHMYTYSTGHLPCCVATSHWNASHHATISYWNTDNYSKPTPTLYCHTQIISYLYTVITLYYRR